MQFQIRLGLILGALILGGALGILVPRVHIEGLSGPPDVAIHELPRDAARNCEPAVFLGEGPGPGGGLPIRTGPGEVYRTRQELSHGDTFLVFEYRGPWAGIVYGHNREVCGAQVRRVVSAPRQGWVPVQYISYMPN
ncbi:hypothetical protein [Oceanicola sp. S124]|uniref:hypothetical protein n=1 Tax=Oceanicola sp. S124 TaxID=1042378 RepID=UPI00025589AC|nr:hypothetical protein [Oceanicola sp. S124]